jgi:hypothetical protein
MHVIEYWGDIIVDDNWGLSPDCNLARHSVVVTSCGTSAQLTSVTLNVWDFHDLETGAFVGSGSIDRKHLPLTVLLDANDVRDVPSRIAESQKNRMRERALAEYFHRLDGGPSALSSGAL